MEPHAVHERRDDLTLLDVRESDEWQEGHLDGAVHIPMGELPQRVEELDRDRPVVAYCRSGRRSAEVAQYLQQAGFDVTNLSGGLERWQSEGLPVVGR